jgi:hypothetical protein
MRQVQEAAPSAAIPTSARDPEPETQLRTLREQIDALIDHFGRQRESAEKPAPRPFDKAEGLRADVEKALASCGYGRADIAPIAEATIDLVDVALLDDDALDPLPGAAYRLRAFEIAIATGGADTDRTFRAGIGPVIVSNRRPDHDGNRAESEPAKTATPAPAEAARRDVKRVALRGARRSLLQGGGDVVRLRFTAITG